MITDAASRGDALADAVEQAVAGGANIVQYRQKDSRSSAYIDDAIRLRSITKRYHAALIINDDPELASVVDADGVHIGRSDAGLAEARATIGRNKIIGVSCYDDINLARRAAKQGADYVAFGSFFTSPVKPDAVKAPIRLIALAKSELTLPVVAIGGIDQANGSLLISAGADALAVISAVFAQSDVCQAAKQLAKLFDHAGAET